MDEINDAMQKYESWTKTQKGMKSNLADFFNRGKPEVFLADGIYRFVKYKEHFFQQLSLQIHKELFEKTEFFKNVAGVLAIRLEPTDGIEDKDRKRQVLLVLNEKTKIWQFPGGKAEYVCHNPNTDKVEIVTQKGDVWQFADGKEAPKDKVTFETPEECLRREISEELDEDVGPATLSSSGFYTIGNSRFLIHGFVAENLLDVDWEKVNRDEIERIDWTSDPFKMEDGSPRPMTDQTKDVLGRFF
ncbi:hypothetical protein A3C21_04265 [Candidatus Kaiserbacteria bacterium RIFCSPHIGHO2_02_FULL_59_21]|uniref:Nudix hydrolase domain-containing protein n=1 Tax=Candidatus Kaiserbacteria bacterium RIFCSPHIGHO2_02_FULL_59_21 TaxID=1798500 RepID=A0A1F6E094_9BACT|nr:MAG: hypothetical protein A3C21_04265 [Candidatus Kaiserbacteria bacterium RIFCSPHIGHO2_02_FULL_59_21]OGG78884.1 MAG: hypothetical protein A2952_00780 [Candidatus Kaiserbacteria bacterium RIFCSPLOWO2_01_FULL_59_34]